MFKVIFCLLVYQVTTLPEQSLKQSNVLELDSFMKSTARELYKFQTNKFAEFGDTKESSSRRSRNLLQQHDAFKIDSCNYSSADRECLDGYSPPIQAAQILNGVTVESRKYPFFVSLQEERFHRGRFVYNCFTHICGGSLIQDDVVVTAAHCIQNFANITQTHLQEVTKKLKAVRESKCRHQKGVEELTVGWILVHPGYEDGVEGSISTFQDDIALLFLRGKMKQKDALVNFQDAYIFEQEAEASGVVSIGFGKSALQKSTEVWSTTLKEISTSLKPKINCVFRLQEENQVSDWNQIYKDDKMLCAYDTSRVATCSGDSGGPLFIQAKNGQYILLGVTSWSLTNQCQSNLVQQPPDVFTRISFYKQWILDNVKAYSGSGVDSLLTFSVVAVGAVAMMDGDMMMPEFPNIVDAAVSTPDLFSLVAAVTAANLVDTLADPELAATVFAPTNAAFDAALDALGITFEDLASDTDSLTEILLYHVVPAKALSTDLVDGMVLTTLGGGNLTVDLSSGVVIEGVGSSASVAAADVTAGMGVVHIIDTVLLPF